MNDPGYQYLSAHNIWGFGKVMHDMMKLDYGDQVDGIMDREISERNYYEKYNEHGIPPITTKKVPEYSSSLRDLIRECLHIKIGKRPSPRALLDRTGRGLQAAAESIRTNPHDFNGPRVYYMGHEINHMPAGNAMRAMRQEDFECIEQDMWPDPTWQPLLAARWAPQVINRELVNEPIVEGGPKREIPPLHATVRKDPRPLEDNPRGVRWALQWPSPRNSEQRDKQGGDEGANNQRGNERTNSQRWRDEMQYQEELGQQLRDSGTHDTLSLSPPPHKERPKSSMNNAPGQGEIPAMPEQEMEQATALLEQWLRETTGVPQSENGPTGQPNPPPKEGGTERQRTPMNNAPGQSEVTAMPEKGVEETAALLEQLVRETTGLPQLETVPSGTRMRSKASTRSADQQPQSEQVPSGPRTRSKGSPLPPEQQPRPENMTADQLNPLPEEGGREIPRTVENRASQQREEEGGATSLPQQENVPSGPQARSNGTTQPPNQQPQLEKVPSGPRTGSKRSTQPPAKQPQPENVPSGPQIEPTGSTQPPNQQPQPKKRKRRAMGLSIDESFQAAESRVVGGRNLRKRQK